MIYLYQCPDCEKVFQAEGPLGQPPVEPPCPACKGAGRRRYLAPTVVYRGEGWAGRGHGVPDMDQREKQPGPLDFSDLTGE